MVAAHDILSKINFPAPTVLAALDALERQLTLEYSDAEGDDGTRFGTLTASRRNTKPFVVGFIPPDNAVNFIPIERNPVEVGTIGGVTGNAEPTAGAGAGQLGPNFWTNYVHMCNRLGIDPKELAKVFNTESGFKPEATNIQNGKVVAQGISQFIKSTAIKLGEVPPEQWETFNELSGEEQLPFIEAYLRKTGFARFKTAGQMYGTHFGGYPLPAVSGYPGGRGYMSEAKYGSLTEAEKAAVDQATGGRTAFMFKAYVQNPAIDTDGDGVASSADLERRMDSTPLQFNIAKNVEAAQAAVQSGAPDLPPGSAQQQAAAAVEDGVDRAIMAFGVDLEGDDPLGRELGRNIRIADSERLLASALQTGALRRQIDLVQAMPALVLLINPKTFSRGYEASSDTSVKGRYGQIVHTWLERPFSLESDGVTAGQYAVDAEGAGGLTNLNRIHTLSYANLLSLVGIYKNNGVLFSGTEADKGIPVLGMSVFIYYDEHIYIGSFDSFSIEDAAEKPYNMSYDFKFTVRYDLPTEGAVLDRLVAATLPF